MFEYPFGNTEELNLDWILGVIKDLCERVEELEERVETLEGE